MPNHVTTRCTVTGPEADIEAFRSKMIISGIDDRSRPYTKFDFDQIIPMPQIVKDVEENGLTPDVLALLAGGGSVAQTWENLRRFDRGEHLGAWKGLGFFERDEIGQRLELAFPGCIAQARRMARSIGETGYKSWYDWSIANWGTKWNSYSFEPISEQPFEFKFDTAWSFPEPIFNALAKEYPTLQFKCVCFDEGWNFAGIGCFNPSPGEIAYEECKATPELYEQVYGEKFVPEPEDAN